MGGIPPAGVRQPSLILPATDGTEVNLGVRPGRFVPYVYPLTGRLGVPLPRVWDAIPGARGCTAQPCGFRNHYAQLRSLHTGVFGLSAQTTDY
jgi:peroxiredoxin